MTRRDPALLPVVIPAYNEERRLPPTLDAAARVPGQGSRSRHEIVVVDDGSRDATAEIARAPGRGGGAQRRQPRQGFRRAARNAARARARAA